MNSSITYKQDVNLRPKGDILVADGSFQAGHDLFGIARCLPSEPEIGSFSASQSPAGAPLTFTASNLTDGNPNSTIGQVTFYYYDGGGN
jgi:hypothetical protein